MPLLARRQHRSRVPAAAVRLKSASGRIEIEFPDGIRVRVDGAVDETVLRGVLTTLGRG